MPNLRIFNTSPKVANKNTIPNVSIKQGGATTYITRAAQTFGGAGYPIGILLAISYIRTQTVPEASETLSSDFKPSVRIFNY